MTNPTTALKIRVFKIRMTSRATPCGEHLGSDYVLTETLTLLSNGDIRVASRAVGYSDGERIDQHDERGSTAACWGPDGFERACTYRLTHGYSEVTK